MEKIYELQKDILNLMAEKYSNESLDTLKVGCFITNDTINHWGLMISQGKTTKEEVMKIFKNQK